MILTNNWPHAICSVLCHDNLCILSQAQKCYQAESAVVMEPGYSSLENTASKMGRHMGEEMVPFRLTVSHITLPG